MTRRPHKTDGRQILIAVTAQGKAVLAETVTHSEGILLVYYSDRVAHGMDRGQLGVTARHQLIIRMP